MVNITTSAWESPGRYIQGPGEFMRLSIHTKMYGRRIFVIIDMYFFEEYTKKLECMYGEGFEFESYCYHTEITQKRIDEALFQAREFQTEVIVGIGGGKAIDMAKCVASELQVPLIVIPTSASTDAPTSAMAIIYNDRHEHEDVFYFLRNPDIVLVDSLIITVAPVRFRVSGMGDALATAYEARATIAMDSNNYICQESGNYRRTRTAQIIAEECLRTILENGVMAKMANEMHIVTEALEAVIEANTLMSGLGFENVGCAAAHCICNGLSSIPGGDKALHGEKVAFGVICQMIAEHAPMRDVEEIMNFNLNVGLPVTLEDMGINSTEENYRIIAGNPNQTEWQREPFYINATIVADIVRCADEMGRMYKNLKR